MKHIDIMIKLIKSVNSNIPISCYEDGIGIQDSVIDAEIIKEIPEYLRNEGRLVYIDHDNSHLSKFQTEYYNEIRPEDESPHEQIIMEVERHNIEHDGEIVECLAACGRRFKSYAGIHIFMYYIPEISEES